MERPSKPSSHAGVAPPDYLDADAREVWQRLAPGLRDAGGLSSLDADLFAAYCQAVVHHRRAVALVNDTAVLLKSPHGPVKHPALQVVRDQAALMVSLAAQLKDVWQRVGNQPTKGVTIRDELKERRQKRASNRSTTAGKAAAARRSS